jgi:hypothetical protein
MIIVAVVQDPRSSVEPLKGEETTAWQLKCGDS